MLFLFVFFVVPGLVTIRTYDLLVPSERRNWGEQFVDLIAYSFLVLAIWGLPYLGLVNNRDSFAPVVYYGLLVVLIVLITVVTPVGVAIGYYKLRTSRYLQGKVPHPAPTAWDYYFQQDRIFWVRFRLKSGAIVAGFYDGGERGAFASTYPQPQQLYINELYYVDDEGRITDKVEGTLGAIINKDDCDLIEFLEYNEYVDETKTEEEKGGE